MWRIIHMSAEDPVVAARRHLTQLLGMRDENVHRDGKFLPIARDAWQALSSNNMWREHVLAFLDLAKTRKNDAAKADDYLWTAFVLACYNRMEHYRHGTHCTLDAECHAHVHYSQCGHVVKDALARPGNDSLNVFHQSRMAERIISWTNPLPAVIWEQTETICEDGKSVDRKTVIKRGEPGHFKDVYQRP